MTNALKRHRNVIVVGLLAAVGVWWWRRRQASSTAQTDTSQSTSVPYYVSSPVPGGGGFYDTGSGFGASGSTAMGGTGSSGIGPQNPEAGLGLNVGSTTGAWTGGFPTGDLTPGRFTTSGPTPSGQMHVSPTLRTA